MPLHSASFLIRRRSLFGKKTSTENAACDGAGDRKSDAEHEGNSTEAQGPVKAAEPDTSEQHVAVAHKPLPSLTASAPLAECTSYSSAPTPPSSTPEKVGRISHRTRTLRELFLPHRSTKHLSTSVPLPLTVPGIGSVSAGVQDTSDDNDMLTFDRFEMLQREEPRDSSVAETEPTQDDVVKDALRRVAANTTPPPSIKPAETESSASTLWTALGDCPICVEGMVKGRAVFVTECGHAFHYACLQGYDSTGELPCPICRTYFKEPPILLKNRKVEAEWFYRITRAEAESLLLADGRNGAFLVRESHTRKGTFTLSFLQECIPRHCRIFNTLDGQFAADSYKAFDTLQDLVEWYRNHPIVGGNDGAPLLSLTYPCDGVQAPTERTVSAPATISRRSLT